MPQLFSAGNRLPQGLDRTRRFSGLFPRTAAIVTALLSACSHADRLLAQEAGGDGGAGGAGNVVVTHPFPWLGLFVTLVLAGLCLFAVCRSSRRN